MTVTPTRDWLAAVLADACRDDCEECVDGFAVPGGHRRPPCSAHAAEAVLDACRREDLFILPDAEARAVLRARARQARAEAYDELAADLDRWTGYGQTMSLESLVEHVQELAAGARGEGSGR